MNRILRKPLLNVLPCMVGGLLLVGLIVTAACDKAQSPLLVGFIGGLTGRVAGLGVAGRDGVILAVEEVNRAGGIGGRRVEIVAKDDRQDPEAARQAVKELAEAGVVAVIGPMTSSMAVVARPAAEQYGLVLVSPTVTTTSLSGAEDNFFRMTVPLRVNADKTVEYALARGLKRFAVSIDTANAAFTEDWFSAFQDSLQARGGEVVFVERYASGAKQVFLPLAERLFRSSPDAVLLLSGAMDTALMAQQLRKLGCKLPLFASEWAFTSDVINFGGSASEELMSFVTYDPDSQSPGHLGFLTRFEERFGYKPSFAAVLSYEAATYLFQGLKHNPQRGGLQKTLQGIGRISGLQGEVILDRFGDPQRQTHLAVIRDGKFVTAP